MITDIPPPPRVSADRSTLTQYEKERAANGGMRQPVFKGLQEDKGPEECVEK